MIRLIFLAGLGYLLYRLIRSILSPGSASRERVQPANFKNRIKDEMVRDPQCQVYIPKGESVSTVIHGERLFFCSKECMEEYLKSHKDT